ncbi:MAG: hypothetical protein JWO06_343 [Bacteroidota bacterium]|nr:hypothetical protein [Bacteroidota bacterium]
MDDEEKKYLADIVLAIENLDVHLQGKRDYRLFEESVTVRSAVKYEFAVIGEAVSELLKLNASIGLTSAVKIISFRNKMVHEYDVIDNAQVWNIIVNYLPLLETEVRQLLKG